MDVRNLDSVSREEQKAILSNAISRCMIENHMTLENLDEAYEIVREIYRKNATIYEKGKIRISGCHIQAGDDGPALMMTGLELVNRDSKKEVRKRNDKTERNGFSASGSGH